jgi:hypothetical protein
MRSINNSFALVLMDPFRQEKPLAGHPPWKVMPYLEALSGSGLKRAHTFRKYVSIRGGVLL